jgi:hypothetical protein
VLQKKIEKEGSGVKIEFIFLYFNLEGTNFINLKSKKNNFFFTLHIKFYEASNKLNFSSPPLSSSTHFVKHTLRIYFIKKKEQKR